MKLIIKTCVICLFSAFIFKSALSAPARSEMAYIANYQGADRSQIILEGAKKEGQLNYYQSRSDIGPVVDAFTKKYGIKVKIYRSSGENLLQRILTEARGGRFDSDVVETSGPQMEALHREQLLQPVLSPFQNILMPQAIPAHREWVGTTMDVYVQAYNTEKINKEDLPKTYEDLLNPRWKGRLGIEADDDQWYATLIQALGPENGARLFKEIVAKNGISVRKGHSLLANLVGSGEVPLALTIYNYSPDQMKEKGMPIETFILPPTISQFVGVGILKKAAHPYAAMLFYDFMLNEGQALLARQYYIPTTNKIDHPLKKIPLSFVDPALNLDMNEKWTRAYEDAVTAPRTK